MARVLPRLLRTKGFPRCLKPPPPLRGALTTRIDLMWKAPLWAMYWITYQIINIPLMALGIPIVGILSLGKLWYTRPSGNPMFLGRSVTAWRFEPYTRPWGNDEDGVVPEGGGRFSAFKWSALRNPTNNLRLLPGASCYLLRPTVGRHLSYDQSGRFQLKFGTRRFGWLISSDAQTGWRSWPVAF